MPFAPHGTTPEHPATPAEDKEAITVVKIKILLAILSVVLPHWTLARLDVTVAGQGDDDPAGIEV